MSTALAEHQIRRLVLYVHPVRLSAVCAAQVGWRIQPDRQSLVWYWLVDCHADCHSSRPEIGALLRALGRYAGRMTVRDMLTAFQVLPRDAELLAFEAGCEDYCEREVDEVEWQGGRVYLIDALEKNRPSTG